jgi:hypothetical protein
LAELNPDGIELSFPFPGMLEKFSFSNQNISNIKKLKYFSIHAPWKEIVYDSQKTTRQLLDKLEQLTSEIDTKTIVFHTDILEEDFFEEIKKYNFVPSFENMDYQKDTGTEHDHIKKILERDSKFRFVFDIAHALDLGEKTTRDLLLLKDKISEVHFSFRSRISNCHEMVSQNNDLKIFDYLKDITVPLILEGVENENDYKSIIEKEINLIQSKHFS